MFLPSWAVVFCWFFFHHVIDCCNLLMFLKSQVVVFYDVSSIMNCRILLMFLTSRSVVLWCFLLRVLSYSAVSYIMGHCSSCWPHEIQCRSLYFFLCYVVNFSVNHYVWFCVSWSKYYQLSQTSMLFDAGVLSPLSRVEDVVKMVKHRQLTKLVLGYGHWLEDLSGPM